MTLVFTSCEDLIFVPTPATELVQEKVFQDDATALAAMASVYGKLADGSSFADGGQYSITLFEALYTDELTSFTSVASSSPRIEFYLNKVTPQNIVVSSTWTRCYEIIYECNRILEGLSLSSKVSLSLQKQLWGEALFIRAFSHFYLMLLFGDIPLVTTSDYRSNSVVSRTAESEIYNQIISDLVGAKETLSDIYPSDERVRVNRGAALALLSRVYLYHGDLEKAEIASTEIISNTIQYDLLADLNSVFLKTSKEAIWQLLPAGGAYNYTNEGANFILLAPPTTWALKTELCDAFEHGDLRRKYWVDSLRSDSGLTTWYFSFKYKERQTNATGSEYSMVLRLSEQYLIRAEARAKLNKLVGENSAESDVNTIRIRAGLPNTIASTQDELLNAIEEERRFELFTEWGHRFFDLKRNNRLTTILGVTKPNWNSADALLPIPQSEMLLNPNLKPQNPGY